MTPVGSAFGVAEAAPVDVGLVVLARYLVLAVPLAIVWLWFRGRAGKLDATFALVAVLASLGASYGLGLLHSHPAPYQLQADTLLSGPPENAFPSQHATVCFAMVPPLLARGRRRLSAAFLVVAVLVSAGRVATGLHFPVDVAGSVLASLLGFGLAWLASDVVAVAAGRVVDVEQRAWETVVGGFR